MQRPVLPIMAQARPFALWSRRAWLAIAAALTCASGAVSADELPVLGRVVSGQEAVLAFPRSGVLAELPAAPTRQVSRGDLVARLSCRTEVAQRDAAVAAIDTMELQYRSQLQLLEYSSTTELEVSLAEAEYNRARADAAVYDAQVSDCRLTAPFDGVVSEVFVDNYEFIAGGDPLLRIIEPGARYFDFMAPSAWLSSVSVASEVTITVPEFALRVAGVIDRIYPEVEPVSQTVRMRAELIEPPTDLRVGLPGIVELSNE